MDAIICYRNDADWQAEAESAQKYFPSTGNRMTIKHGQLVIPRFSALPFFKEFEEEMLYINCRLINSYNQHRYIADLGNWYYDLHEFTPMTWKNLYELPEDKSFILKGETNSRKFLWKTHCFAENKQDAIRVHTNLTNDSLIQYQQIYIREYVPLEKLYEAPQNLPITREYRFFIYKNTILSGGFYWSNYYDDLIEMGFKLDTDEVPQEFLNKIIQKIQNTEVAEPPTFYVIDVAKTADGRYIVIELNDGCMSGLSMNDPDIMYSNLKKALEADGIQVIS